MSAGPESVFPKIAPDHPLAEAARITNAMAEERGLEATLEWLGIGEAGELAYLAEQRALRAVAASGPGVNMSGLEGGMGELVARLIMQTPLWRDTRALLVACYLDGFAIGYKGRELAEPWRVPFEDLMDSVRLAMTSANIDPEQVDEVITTVTDYAANKHGDD